MLLKNFYRLLFGSSDKTGQGYLLTSVENSENWVYGSLAYNLTVISRFRLLLSPDINTENFTTYNLTNRIGGSVASSVVKGTSENGADYLLFTMTYTNSSGSSVTINSAGVTLNDNYSDMERRSLLFFNNLSEPVTVANGETLTIVFRVDIGNGSSVSVSV